MCGCLGSVGLVPCGKIDLMFLIPRDLMRVQKLNPERRSVYLTPLMRAAAIGNSRTVSYLIENGADVNERGPRDSTALMFAAGGGHTDIVEMLVDSGADINAREHGGWTALAHALADGHMDIISVLKQKGAAA